MEPASLRSTDRAQTHPEGEPQARIGSAQGHRNPPSPCCSRALEKRRGRHPSPVSSGRRGHLTAPQRPADSTGDVGDGSRWGRKSVGDHPGPAAERHPIERCQEKEAPGSPDTLSGAANNDTGRAFCDARPGGKTDVVRRGIRRRTHTREGDAVRTERSPRSRATGRCRSCSGRSRGRPGTRSRRPRNGSG